MSLAFSGPLFAQDNEADDEDVVEEEEQVTEEIVVTGSRLKKSTFSSIAPLQVITTEFSREVGLIDPADILQESSSAAGQQIDLTFGGLVTPNGPGSSTINLRALGAQRTLVLIDGRRAAPAGVEGAPFAADLNLIPGALVQQYEILLDGASSVYGSDAVAGVTNVILRKDFEGLEVESFTSSPDQSGGLSNTVSLAWGKNTDRGFFGIGIEYEDNEEVVLNDRSWTGGCDTSYEIDQNGQIRTQNEFDRTVYGMRDNGCDIFPLSSRVAVPIAGSIYYTPGSTNGAWPNFSESSQFGAIGVDGNGDGVPDVSFSDYSINGLSQNFETLYPDFERTSVMAYGEYTFEGEMNLTPFFEAQYNKREVFINIGAPQFFPDVPANNPFNLCNPNGVRGVDCGLAWDALLDNPNFAQQVANTFGLTPAQFRDFGIVDLYAGAIGPAGTQPIVTIPGDRNMNDIEVDQTRIVAGLRGDLPFINWGSMKNWDFELAAIHAKSNGTSTRTGLRGDLFDLSVATTIEDPNNPGTFICGADADGDGIPDGTDGCVPIDMFAPSLYDNLFGEFATAAEREYLTGTRAFETEYQQQIISLFASGNIFELPGGSAAAGIGVEYREDEIRSIPNDVARDGLFFGFSSDEGASGEKYTREFFGEMELPFVAGKNWAKELTLNLSARNTKDEFYGSAWTYSGKLGYRPVDSLLLRATYGTSFRAPNLRENFLANQTGFATVTDPCFIPESAIDPISGGYNPAGDGRDPNVLANCAANGADPFTLNNNGFNTYGVERGAGGGTFLDEETSDSISLGFAFEQPWLDSFDLTVGATYYKIDIEDTIVEPGGQFIVNDCYNSPTGNSVFCDRITRDSDGFLDFLDGRFVNRDEATAEGVDINIALDTTVTMFERPVDWRMDVALNHGLENSETFVGSAGSDFQDFQGVWGIPDWQGQIGLRADVGKLRLTWNTRFIGAVQQLADDVDPFGDIFGSNGVVSDTCFGPPDDVLCRDASFADDYFVHGASVYYYGDVWTFGFGIRNIFNQEPPRVDQDEDLETVNAAGGNTPIGYGYDLNGRAYFINIAANFPGFQ